MGNTVASFLLSVATGMARFVVSAAHHYVAWDGSGRLQPGDRHAVVAPADAAASGPPISAGAMIPLVTAEGLQEYTVVGVIEGGAGIGMPHLYVTLADAQSIFHQPGMINALELAIRPGADRDSVIAAVERTLGAGFVVGSGANPADAVASLEVGYAMFNLPGLMALFMGGFLIFNTFRTVVLERRHDLGMLPCLEPSAAR